MLLFLAGLAAGLGAAAHARPEGSVPAAGDAGALTEPEPSASPEIPDSSPPAGSTEPEEKLIALTFDDGPSPKNTTALLDGLAQRGVSATFFLVGSMVESSPRLVERMEEEGHQIAVHTYNHDSASGLRGLSEAQFDAQVGVTSRMLTELTGQTEFALRPPYGFVDDGVRQREPGPIILWSVDTEDWKYRDTRRVVRHVLDNARDGSVVLLHDIFATSVDAALQIVDALQAQGYRFVTVDELFALRGVELRRGEVYHCAYPPDPGPD